MKRLAVIGLLLLAGCQVDQKQEVEMYERLLRLTDEPVTHEPGEPLSLRKALLLANQNDEQLAITGEDFLQAIIERRRTIANFLPTLDLGVTYARSDRTSSSSSDNGTGTSTSGNNSGDGTLNVPVDGSISLFNGFRDINAAWRDEFIARQRAFELRDAQERLLLDTAAVYFQVLRAESSVRVLESSLQLQEERFRDVAGRRDAGLASPLAVSQTEAQVAETRTTLITARDDVVQARLQLALLTAAPMRTSPLSDEFSPGEPPSLEFLMEQARNARDDLRAAEAAVTAAKYDVEVAVGQYYPSVTFDVTGYLYRESVPDDRRWEALLGLNLPIFSAGRIEADVREAWSNLRQALLARSLLERTVRSQVEQAYESLRASEARTAQLHVQVDVATQLLNQAEQSYQAGLATNLDRIQAQDAQLQAQLQLAAEAFDRKLLALTLLQRAGLLREQLAPVPTTQPVSR